MTVLLEVVVDVAQAVAGELVAPGDLAGNEVQDGPVAGGDTVVLQVTAGWVLVFLDEIVRGIEGKGFESAWALGLSDAAQGVVAVRRDAVFEIVEFDQFSRLVIAVIALALDAGVVGLGWCW